MLLFSYFISFIIPGFPFHHNHLAVLEKLLWSTKVVHPFLYWSTQSYFPIWLIIQKHLKNFRSRFFTNYFGISECIRQVLLLSPLFNLFLLHNLPPNTNHITCRHLEIAYQFVLSSRHNPGINLNPKLSRDTVFTMCSHTFPLVWSRKTSVIIPTFQLSFRVCVCVCLSSRDCFNFCKSFLFLFLFFFSSIQCLTDLKGATLVNYTSATD